MQRSWAENKSQSLLYTSEFLSSCFAYPGANFHLAPAIYDGPKLVAFIAGFPRRVRWNGTELRIVVLSFLTVLSEYKSSGYGLVLWNEVIKRARAAGFDGFVNYLVHDEPMDKMMPAYLQRLKLPAAKLFTVQYLTRLNPPKPAKTERENADSRFIENFLREASRTTESVPLTRIWSREEAEWQCVHRADSIVASYSAGERQGILTGQIMQIANRENTRCLLIDDVLWDDLVAEERRTLVQKLVDSSASAGARMCIVPLLGYMDPEPFVKARFLRSPRVLNTYFCRWNGVPSPEPVNSFYLDVL
jgi:GNAT superfamily N-acetyltransferase